MYTVFRFTGKYESIGELERVGSQLNVVLPGTFTGFDRVPGRFSISIHDSLDPEEHWYAIREFLSKCGGIVSEARGQGIVCEIDIAVNNQDVEHSGGIIMSLSVPLHMMELLCRFGVELVVTLYP